MRKILLLFYFLILMFVCKAQQNIGNFPTFDGGFENQTAGTIPTASSIANATTKTTWTVQNTSGTGTISSTGGRSGPYYATFGATASRRFQSPTAANGAVLNTTSYVLQYYYRTSGSTAPTSFAPGASPDGTGSGGGYVATVLSGTSNAWVKGTTITTTSSSSNSTKYGIAILRFSAASGVDVDFDDFVMYPGSSVDNIVPDQPTSPVTSGISSTSVTVSWTDPSTGVDGGGYLVLRYIADPTGAAAPLVNGIYNLGNTIGTGTVAYIGSTPSFTDNGRTPGTQYYYVIYTVDKAFNYSSSITTSATTLTGGVLTSVSNLSFANTNLNVNSAEQSFTVSGAALTANLVVTAPSGFQITTTSGSGYGSSISLTPSGGAVSTTTIYAISKPGSPGTQSGNITVSSTGYSSNTIAVSGYGSANYQSIQTGNWSDASTWQYYNGSSWANSSTIPSNNDLSITIQAGHNVTINSSVSVGQVIVNGTLTIPAGSALTIMHGTASSDLIVANGGSFINQGSISIGTSATWEIQNGATYIHNNTGATSAILGALTIDAGSTFIYDNAASSPSVSGKTFHNLTVRSSTGTYTLATSGSFTVNGKLSVGTNVIWTSTSTATLNGDIDLSGTLTTNSFTLAASKIFSIYPSGLLLIPTGQTVTIGSGSLIILSDATGTGSVGNSAGSISGNITVQRYIGTNNTWRMIGFPFGNGMTVSASTLATLYGSGYNAYTYNEGADDQTNYGNSGSANAGWTTFTGSATTTADKGILMAGGSPATILSATGTLNMGAQSIALTKAKNGWNFIANPYASKINWTTIAANNASVVNNAIYRYDPIATAYATYIGGVSAGNQTNVIENGAGFFVQATAAGNLAIAETDKTTSAAASQSLMGSAISRGAITTDGVNTNVANNSIIRLTVLKDGETVGDQVALRWGVDPATDGFDGKYDAYDLGRVKGADISVVDNNGVKYSIFHGSELKEASVETRTIKLSLTQLSEGSYTIGSELLSPISGGNTASLYDSYTGNYTVLDDSNPTYTFNVGSDAASQAVNRFSIVFNAKAVVNEAALNNSISLLNNPSSGNGFTLYSKDAYNTVQWQLIDNAGRSVQSGALNNVQKGSTYQVNTQNALQGLYIIKLIGDNKNLAPLKLVKQ